MRYHILNGDALAEKFPSSELPGTIIVIREAFMDGPLATNLNDSYWHRRADFIHEYFNATPDEYNEQFLSQVRLLDHIHEEDEINLWFEDDLFCIINMLFVLYYLKDKSKPNYYRIFPVADNKQWAGFGRIKNNEFQLFYDHRKLFDEEELVLSHQLWEAIAEHDMERLKLLSFSDTNCFRFLPEVIQAHIDRHPADGGLGRPYRTLIEILNNGKTNFYEIYEDFILKEGIYGYGDVQVYNMLKELGMDGEYNP